MLLHGSYMYNHPETGRSGQKTKCFRMQKNQEVVVSFGTCSGSRTWLGPLWRTVHFLAVNDLKDTEISRLKSRTIAGVRQKVFRCPFWLVWRPPVKQDIVYLFLPYQYASLLRSKVAREIIDGRKVRRHVFYLPRGGSQDCQVGRLVFKEVFDILKTHKGFAINVSNPISP